MFETIANYLYYKLSDKDNELNYEQLKPPGAIRRLEFGEIDPANSEPLYVVTTGNDGSEIWIGFNNGSWLFHCCMDEARSLAKFVLIECWLKGSWLGLKRKVWFWLLSYILKKHFENTLFQLVFEETGEGE